MKFATPIYKRRRTSAFTLAEVLAALMFMAIVIPVVVEALHLSSVAGEIAALKADASRVADKVLNESLVTTNWVSGQARGTVIENRGEFEWTVNNEPWSHDPTLQLLTAEVSFLAAGREHRVHLKTLAYPPSTGGGF